MKILKNFLTENYKFNINPKKPPLKLSEYRGKYIRKFLERNKEIAFKNVILLDLGIGWGDVSSYFAGICKSVIGIDIRKEQLSEIKKRRIKNLELVNSNAQNLPFRDRSFDIVILCGVLEWVGYGEKNPEKIQMNVLKEVNRILKLNGTVYLGIENRFGLNFFLGALEHHTNLPFISLLPRKLGNLYSKLIRGKKYTEYTYSKYELEKLLKSTGFYTKFYTALPDYGHPFKYYKLNKKDLLEYGKDIRNLKYSGFVGKIVSKVAVFLARLGILKNLPFDFVVECKKISLPFVNFFVKRGKKNIRTEFLLLKNTDGGNFKIPRPYFFDEEDKIIVMEYINGDRLSNILRKPWYSKKEKMKLIKKIAKNLGKFHIRSTNNIKIKKYLKTLSGTYKDLKIGKNNIICQVHGDFNPRNIIINENDTYLVDFEDSCYGSPLIDVYYFIDSLYVVSCLNPFLSEKFRKTLEDTFLKSYFDTTNFDFQENLKKNIRRYIDMFFYIDFKNQKVKGIKSLFMKFVITRKFKKMVNKKI